MKRLLICCLLVSCGGQRTDSASGSKECGYVDLSESPSNDALDTTLFKSRKRLLGINGLIISASNIDVKSEISNKEFLIPIKYLYCEQSETCDVLNPSLWRCRLTHVSLKKYYIVNGYQSDEALPPVNVKFLEKFELEYPYIIGFDDTFKINRAIRDVYIEPKLEYDKEKYLMRRNACDSLTFAQSKNQLLDEKRVGNSGVHSVSVIDLNGKGKLLSIIAKGVQGASNEEGLVQVPSPVYYMIDNNSLTSPSDFLNKNLVNRIKNSINKYVPKECNTRNLYSLCIMDFDVNNWLCEFKASGLWITTPELNSACFHGRVYVYVPYKTLQEVDGNI